MRPTRVALVVFAFAAAACSAGSGAEPDATAVGRSDSTVSDGVPTTPRGSSSPTSSPTSSAELDSGEAADGPIEWRAFEVESIEIERRCLGESVCTQIRVDVDNVTVSYDPTTRTLTRHLTPPITTVVPDAYGDVYIELLGPDDVVYLNVEPLAQTELAADLVAVSLTGDDSGREIGRWAGVTDRTGDVDLVPTPAGIVKIGCCGPDDVRPAPDADVAVAWIDRDGQPVVRTEPFARVELRYPSVTISRHSPPLGSYSWRFTLGDAWQPRGMPPYMPTSDGGIIATFPSDPGELVARGWPDGTTQVIQLREHVEALTPTGVIITADHAQFFTVELFDKRAE